MPQLKKARFYADENFFPKSVDFLKSKKFNILHSVADLGFQGRDDKFHFNEASKLARVLITLDTDFLDNRRYKLRKTQGVIVLIVPPPVTSDKVNKLISELMPMLKRGKDYFKAKKIKATPDGTTIWSVDKSGGLSTANYNLSLIEQTGS